MDNHLSSQRERKGYSDLLELKKICRVVMSTLAGETFAMAEGIDVAIFVSTLFTDLTTGTPATDGLPLISTTVSHFMML